MAYPSMPSPVTSNGGGVAPHTEAGPGGRSICPALPATMPMQFFLQTSGCRRKQQTAGCYLKLATTAATTFMADACSSRLTNKTAACRTGKIRYALMLLQIAARQAPPTLPQPDVGNKGAAYVVVPLLSAVASFPQGYMHGRSDRQCRLHSPRRCEQRHTACSGVNHVSPSPCLMWQAPTAASAASNVLQMSDAQRRLPLPPLHPLILVELT